MGRATDIPIDHIDRDPDQPRKHFSESKLRELADNIKQYGLMQPIVLRPMGKRYTIVAGERRWRACKLAGLTEVPATIMPAGADHVLLSIMENLHREDLNLIEESDAFTALLKRLGDDEQRLIEVLGKPTGYARDRLRLQALSPKMRQVLVMGGLTLPSALHLCKLDHANQDIAFRRFGQMNSKHWGRMVESMAEIQQQPEIFAIPRLTQQQIRVRDKYDAMMEDLTTLIVKSFKADELEVLAKVLRGDVHKRVDQIDLIVKHLLKIADALRRAKGAAESLKLLQEGR